ncbi:hypothetical protein FRIGORI9N_430023 [Frigoribacterium sp. 9N]|nr:hypothetical protein FRIGORI9N_430023 [Frigoribacterium sp. 9N]
MRGDHGRRRRRAGSGGREGDPRLLGELGLVGEDSVDAERHEGGELGLPVAEGRLATGAAVGLGQEGVLGAERPGEDVEAGRVRPVDDPTVGRPLRVDERVLVEADAVQACVDERLERLGVQLVAVAHRGPPRRDQVGCNARLLEQVDEPGTEPLVGQTTEHRLLERLDGQPRVVDPAPLPQLVGEQLAERQADGVEVGGVLDLGDEPDGPIRRVEQVEQVAQPLDAPLAVVRRALGPQLGQPFADAQRAELVPGEVLGEPARDLRAVDGLGRAPVSELVVVGDVGRARDLVLVPQDEHAVARRDQVGLDGVGPEFDRETVGVLAVLGSVTAGAAMGDDERRGGHPVTLTGVPVRSPSRPTSRREAVGGKSVCGETRRGGPWGRGVSPPTDAKDARHARSPCENAALIRQIFSHSLHDRR